MTQSGAGRTGYEMVSCKRRSVKRNSYPIQDESFMTVPVTRGDENGGRSGVAYMWAASGPKAVSGSGADKARR
jgi:hypothetical protein